MSEVFEWIYSDWIEAIQAGQSKDRALKEISAKYGQTQKTVREALQYRGLWQVSNLKNRGYDPAKVSSYMRDYDDQDRRMARQSRIMIWGIAIVVALFVLGFIWNYVLFPDGSTVRRVQDEQLREHMGPTPPPGTY